MHLEGGEQARMVTEQATTIYTCPDGTPFPVVWPEPENEQHGWRWDHLHVPLPLTPLAQRFSDSKRQGFGQAMDAMGAPAGPARVFANGFTYIRQQPFADDPTMREHMRARDLARRMDRIGALWEEQYRPEVEALTHALRSYAGLSLRALVERLEQLHAIDRRLGELHMLVMGPTQPGYLRLVEFCGPLYGAEAEQVAAELARGMPNRSLDSAQGLWDLSREAAARPAVAAVFRDAPVAELAARIPTVAGGATWWTLFQDYLEVFGLRTESFTELVLPSWQEQPRFPLLTIRAYLATPEESSPEALHAASARVRERRQAEVEDRLAGDPERLARFRAILPVAQQRTVLIEDHNFYIDQQGPASLRLVLLAMGGALARQGSLVAAEDIFYVTEEEIRKAAAVPETDLRLIAAARRTERERWLHVIPPAFIGNGTVETNPFTRGFLGPDEGSEPEPGAVGGVAASPGVRRGRARLILTLEEAEKLEPGDILVTYATAPPWTPLFAVAGAVVTDAGGMLSHCAVVAREYGIPAVTGTRTATRRIPDGALITVDGTRGLVRVEA